VKSRVADHNREHYTGCLDVITVTLRDDTKSRLTESWCLEAVLGSKI